jgi:adenosylhomocysteine nucleosidase
LSRAKSKELVGRSQAPQEVEALSESCKVAIVAALEREVWPLVKDWSVRRKEFDGRWFKFFSQGGVALVCGGMGAAAARRAAEAIINVYHPELVISAGFAGGLDPALQVGHTLTPRHVIDANDGSRTDSGFGEGVLISFADIADVEQKTRLGQTYGAHAVDMEAAAVARSAEAHGVKFLACKVISDASGSSLPPIARFISGDGKFHALRFLAHIAVRPWLWSGVQRLATDSAMAAGKLCQVLTDVGKTHVAEKEEPVITR